MKQPKNFIAEVKNIYTIIVAMSTVIGFGVVVCIMMLINPTFFISADSTTGYIVATIEEDEDKIENGIHVRTGFVDDIGLMETVNNCTNCHSSKLVIQNRMSKERWLATIKWMQETQNLWDLGGNEAIIVKYLAENYAPENKGRRENLSGIEWYELNN